MIRVTLWAAALLACTASTTIGTAGATAATTGVKAAGLNREGLPTARVSYGDLNLATAAGKKALRDRIWNATRLVCIEPGAGMSEPAASACRRVSRAKVEPQILAAIDKANSPQFASTGAESAKDR